MTRDKICLYLQSFICVLIAVMLSAAAVGIYRDGTARKAEDPGASVYTYENVKEGTSPAVPVVVMGLVLTFAGIYLGIKDEKADKPVKDTEIARDLTCNRVAEPSPEMYAERELQKKLGLGRWIAAGACMIPVFIYIVNPAHFDRSDAQGLEMVIGSMVLHTLPWVILAFIILSVTTVLLEKSMKRQTEAAAARLKEEKEKGLKPDADTGGPVKNSNLKIIRVVMFAIAVICIIAGILNGSMHDVLAKAILVCTECVGLG